MDDARNDIYIHLDVKAKFDISDLSTNYSGLYILPNQLDARWGDFSLVEVELRLMAEATERAEYSYYHLLSGVDFPIASQNVIHDFSINMSGKSLLGLQIMQQLRRLNGARSITSFFKVFQIQKSLMRLSRRIFADIQSLVGYKRFPGVVKKDVSGVVLQMILSDTYCQIKSRFMIIFLILIARTN